MKDKKNPPVSNKIYVCPRCLDYHYSSNRICGKCNCKKSYTSVLKNKPSSIEQIPKEDWERIIAYRKLNGYNYLEYEKMYYTAPLLGVCIPRDEKPSYVMRGLRRPKNQRGGFGGVANHTGVGGNLQIINGGSCTPK